MPVAYSRAPGASQKWCPVSAPALSEGHAPRRVSDVFDSPERSEDYRDMDDTPPMDACPPGFSRPTPVPPARRQTRPSADDGGRQLEQK
jgi:hypothetical protein